MLVMSVRDAVRDVKLFTVLPLVSQFFIVLAVK
jgi:hypothetical protein